ncbi:MAG: M14 family metallopeptidase [Acidobacteria bacterium]|nr:M14 family metallopeptidase [Acidobacteriota bacterium]MCL5288816.1 M14 family metallopeptidase [Acidobacteriota bacterium]
MLTRRLLRIFAVILLAALCVSAQELPTPEKYLGFRVGTDKKLATWPQVVEYMRMAAKTSDRVRVTDLDNSTMGNPFILLTISSPQNLARLAEIQADQRKLAYPYALDEKSAEAIFAKNPAVVLITMTIHSSEVGSTQMSLELVHRLATEHSPYIENLLDNVVFLLAPSVNPDGQVMIVDWYNKNVGTEFEFSPMPWLYHKYVGHDNNRDAFMLTQIETRNVIRVLYKDWFPLIFLDEHQMGSSGARIFVPPFTDPINLNQDPLVRAGSSLLGMYMFTALNAAGYEGVEYGRGYPWWYQGPAKNGAWWHNMVGLLTEVASARLASPVEQQRTQLYAPARPATPGAEGGPGAGGGDPRRPLPPPNDTWARTQYPKPWLGGTWRLRDIVDYELVITYALLEGAAANRVMFQRNFYNLNRKAIETGRKGDPFAYIIPEEQHDRGATWKLLEVLDLTGIEIFRAKAAFEAGGIRYESGSYVIPMAQPFRGYAKDILEPQKYPMRPAAPGQAPERPYDVTGWTLPLQMGVAAIEVKKPFDAPLEKLSTIEKPKGDLVAAKKGGAPAFVVAPGGNNSSLLANRLLKAGADISWTTDFVQASSRGWRYPPGSLIVRNFAYEKLRALVEELGLTGEQFMPADDSKLRANVMKLRAPRIAMYQPWAANMDEGWTRWLLEKYEFPYTSLHNEDIRAGKLNDKYDVIIFASQSKNGILNGNRGEWVRPEYRGGIGDDGAKAIEDFVRAGGTLVALDDASNFAIDTLGLPVRNILRGVPSDKFYCPGAVLEIFVDNRNPIAYGLPQKTSAYFLNSPAFEISAPFTENSARAVAKYPSTNPLQSGWIGGPEYLYDKVAAAEVSVGKGRVVLLGFRAQFRAQPHATFKLLFNSLHSSAASR